MIFFLKVTGAWLFMLFVGLGLINPIVRGLFVRIPTDHGSRDAEEQREFVAQAGRGLLSSGVFALLACGYLYYLWSNWNWLLALAALLQMLSNIPNLLWEVRYGRRISPRDGPKSWLYQIDYLLILGSWPLVWMAL